MQACACNEMGFPLFFNNAQFSLLEIRRLLKLLVRKVDDLSNTRHVSCKT